MKKGKLNKLAFKKETISSLQSHEMESIKGGTLTFAILRYLYGKVGAECEGIPYHGMGPTR